MKLKRIFTSVSAQFDDLVGKIENHEAVAESAIRAARQQTAKIQSQLNLTTKRLTELETRYDALEKKTDTWKQRAISSGNEDREKALRCLQAMKNTQSEIAQVLNQIKETTALQTELRHHLQESEQQVISLQSRKESLAARSAKNSVKKYTGSVVDDSDLNTVFDRWEQNLAADEYLTTPHQSSEDYLDQEFTQVENQEALQEELEQLMRQPDANQKESRDGQQ